MRETRPLVDRVQSLETAMTDVIGRLAEVQALASKLDKILDKIPRKIHYVKRHHKELDIIKCSCGAECRGKVGLAAHQRQTGHEGEWQHDRLNSRSASRSL